MKSAVAAAAPFSSSIISSRIPVAPVVASPVSSAVTAAVASETAAITTTSAIISAIGEGSSAITAVSAHQFRGGTMIGLKTGHVFPRWTTRLKTAASNRLQFVTTGVHAAQRLDHAQHLR